MHACHIHRFTGILAVPAKAKCHLATGLQQDSNRHPTEIARGALPHRTCACTCAKLGVAVSAVSPCLRAHACFAAVCRGGCRSVVARLPVMRDDRGYCRAHQPVRQPFSGLHAKGHQLAGASSIESCRPSRARHHRELALLAPPRELALASRPAHGTLPLSTITTRALSCRRSLILRGHLLLGSSAHA